MEDLITGADGQVRGACIRVRSSGNRSSLLRRPVQLLYPLEGHRQASANHGPAAVDKANESLSVPGVEQADQSERDEANDHEAEASVPSGVSLAGH